MGVYQDWQKEKDIAKEKLVEAEEHLRNSLKESQDSSDSPTTEFKNRVRKCSLQILDILDKL